MSGPKKERKPPHNPEATSSPGRLEFQNDGSATAGYLCENPVTCHWPSAPLNRRQLQDCANIFDALKKFARDRYGLLGISAPPKIAVSDPRLPSAGPLATMEKPITQMGIFRTAGRELLGTCY